MEGAGTSHAITHLMWWTIGLVGSALVVFTLAFLPWYHLTVTRDSAALDAALPGDMDGFTTLLGGLAVLASSLGGLLAVMPATAARHFYVAPALSGAVLAVARLVVPPSSTFLGETLSYSRTTWVILVAAFALIEGACAVLCASLRNQEPAA